MQITTANKVPSSVSEASQILREMILLAISRMQKLQKDDTLGSEENPVPFGNVEFWTAANGDFCYSIPAHSWDCARVTRDLQYWF